MWRLRCCYLYDLYHYHFSVPEPPDRVNIYNVKETSFRVEWTDKNSQYTHLRVVVEPYSPATNFSAGCANNDTRNCTFERNVTAVDITGLVSGTYYTVKLYSVINGTSRERAAENHTYTCKSILYCILRLKFLQTIKHRYRHIGITMLCKM
jgi:hypothetical protein